MGAFDRDANLRILKALEFNYYKKLASAEELHAFAQCFNWDFGSSEMRWVVNHPKCDLGTAIMIYWNASPLFYFKKYSNRSDLAKGKPDYMSEVDHFQNYDLIKLIEEKINKGEFRSQKIRFSIDESPEFFSEREDYDALLKNNELKQPIHSIALLATPGETFAHEVDWSLRGEAEKRTLLQRIKERIVIFFAGIVEKFTR
jgi:Domain of unknown function (DUF4274)